MTPHSTIFEELDRAIRQGSTERRAEMLLKITDFFIHGSVRLSDGEIDLFDNIITRLASEIEVSVRSILAQRLAPLANAPLNITRILANDSEITVAGPILELSERLDDASLIESAETKSQEHLLAISRRKSLPEEITDILIVRGEQNVLINAANNAGARFSSKGFAELVERAEGDDRLTTAVGFRSDIPHRLFLVLLANASERVRTKLITENPLAKRDVEAAVAAVEGDLAGRSRLRTVNYSAAHALVQWLHESGQLTDDTIQEFVRLGKFAEIVEAIGRICNLPIEFVERAMIEELPETLLVLAKAAKLSWQTTKMLLTSSIRSQGQYAGTIEQSMASFERLNVKTALQIIEFYRKRRSGPP